MGLEFIHNRLTSLKSFLSRNDLSKASAQTNPISQIENEPQFDNEPARVDSATVLAQYYNIHQAKNQIPIVKPLVFPRDKTGGLNVHGEYKSKPYPYYDSDGAVFTSQANAKKLQMKEPNNKVIEISNFDDPSGTIAGSTTLGETLYTDRLAQCAALAVVDKAHNTQTLIHVYPGYTVDSNKQLINHVLNSSNPKDLEVSIVPGYSKVTQSTVQFLLDTVKEYSKDIEVQLFNFPNEYLGVFNRGLLLQNGKLYCCDINKVTDKITNPKENISYIEQLKYASIGDKKLEEALEKTEFNTEFDFEKLKQWASDNNLKLQSYNGGFLIEFEDNDNNLVRKVTANNPDKSTIRNDIRMFYNTDGSPKGELEKNENGEIVYYYSFDEQLKIFTDKAYLNDGCWGIKRFGEFKKLPNNPITGEPQ